MSEKEKVNKLLIYIWWEKRGFLVAISFMPFPCLLNSGFVSGLNQHFHRNLADVVWTPHSAFHVFSLDTEGNVEEASQGISQVIKNF